MELKLNNAGLADAKAWADAGYAIPAYDREAMVARTKENPYWVHFGAGNIFRAFQANVAQNLLNEGVLDRGIVVAEGFDYEIISKMYTPHDNLSVLVTLKADGSVEKTVVGSIAESLIADGPGSADFDRLKEIFTKDSLQMATFTITEKGYSLVNGRGEMIPAVTADFANGPEKASSYIGKVSALLYERYLAGEKPIAMVSMDNCSHNGDKLYQAIEAFAKTWEENGVVKAGFHAYVNDPAKVSFPWSMIDKITPRPDPSIQEMLKKDNLEDPEPVVTTMHTYVAPFVNAEECQYLVIEDSFPNGRPALDKGGFIFTSRETVNETERMKVCTCLNPLHTALAVFGCLLDYSLISEEMKNTSLRKLVERIGYTEGLPVVTDPGIISPKKFIDEVLNVRIPNPFMPDTPQRIATDTSQKLSIRFGETIKAYMASPELNVDDLKCIPVVFAGWLRYLMGINDKGEEFTLSPDPRLDTVRPYVQDLKLGEEISKEDLAKQLAPLLSNESIFGVNLCEIGMCSKVLDAFVSMLKGPGAVADTLAAVVA
ncbi:MAG: mannitol dehydrogenase family protein [Fusicatenibacter sp.]|nr:mannitol dehydrogenase family protein [Fusicatenibacter sp.]